MYLAQIADAAAAITHMVPQITYAGEYPTVPLTDQTHGGFNVNVTLHTWAIKPTNVKLDTNTSWGSGASTDIAVPAGNSSFTVTLPVARDVKLWWPVGQGPQPLYYITASLTPSGDAERSISITRRVGFRVFALVTG